MQLIPPRPLVHRPWHPSLVQIGGRRKWAGRLVMPMTTRCFCNCHFEHSSRAACEHCYPLVLFCGSRTWNDQRHVDTIMAQLLNLFNGRFRVIQGGAFGADNQAWLAAKKLNVPVETVKPDWSRFGSRAGFIRNVTMLEKKPQYVIALWNGISRGTQHTIERAVNVYRIPTLIVRA